jgi:excisionase family DNA binding protein
MVTRDEAIAQAAVIFLEAKIRIETERILAEHAERIKSTAPPLIDGRHWMTEHEVSQYTKISVSTLRDWRRTDRVRVLPYHPLGRLIRYDRAEVDAALEQGRVDP